MLQSVLAGLSFVAFLGAGAFNAIGTAATRRDFVRWGYPAWWCYVTGALEIAAAALIAVASTRLLGVALGAGIVLVAAFTVLRRREFSHLAPLAAFAALLTATALIG